MNKARIAIIGAGPAGLTLARILHIHAIKSCVFEREAFSSVRPQGRSLDMHADTGQFAIERAGLRAEFKRIARYEDQQLRVYDKQGRLLFVNADGSEGDRPEVDRAQLRQMLLDSLPSGTVRWGQELSAIRPEQDEMFELTFKNGASETFHLVVGADGAWSRVRPLVSKARPIYSGVTLIEMGIADADARHSELASLVGRGMMFAIGDSKAIIGHRDANAHVGIYAGMRVPEDWFKNGGLDTSSDEALKAGLADYFADWSESLLQLIRKSDVSVTPRPIYALPVGHRWEHRRGVTLLGDAAHLMSPFGGDGANLAMRDAADLAQALTMEDDWKAAVQNVEEVMFVRAEQAAAGARDGINETFSKDGLAHILEHMREHRG